MDAFHLLLTVSICVTLFWGRYCFRMWALLNAPHHQEPAVARPLVAHFEADATIEFPAVA